MALPETVGGYTLCPRKGVMYMDYLVIMAIIWFITESWGMDYEWKE